MYLFVGYHIMSNDKRCNVISKYYIHFAKGNKKEFEIIKKKSNKKQIKLNNNYDKLFFNFLLIVKMDSLGLDYNKNIETNLKYEFAQKMENMKFKKIENVINNLCYEENINLKTLSALCCLFSKSMFYYSHNVFINLNENTTLDCHKVYLVRNDSSILCIKGEKQKELQDVSYKIDNLDKIFYSITHYKVDNLKNIGQLLGVNIDGKKKDIYERISQHLSNAIIIKN